MIIFKYDCYYWLIIALIDSVCVFRDSLPDGKDFEVVGEISELRPESSQSNSNPQQTSTANGPEANEQGNERSVITELIWNWNIKVGSNSVSYFVGVVGSPLIIHDINRTGVSLSITVIAFSSAPIQPIVLIHSWVNYR